MTPLSMLRGEAFPANIDRKAPPALQNARRGAFSWARPVAQAAAMKHLATAAALLALASAVPLGAQEEPEGPPSPNQIVEQASADEWQAIASDDLLVMTLAPPDRGPGQASADGSEREVVIQLMPPPFSQGWVDNIRTLARAGWYDGISINRVQDNYVVQWGDPNVDNPEATGPAKALPEALKVMGEESYATIVKSDPTTLQNATLRRMMIEDPYADLAYPISGWPVAMELPRAPIVRTVNAAAPQVAFPKPSYIAWPVHCYGMVGVGRSYSPDTGSGAELYTVIGHAPRHLDRNIALVGRVVEGIEHLSSLPRGKGALGFYEDPAKRVPIRSIRVASDLAASDQPRFEYLSTESETFARYAEARANRRDPFFIVPAGGADICNIPVPVRRVAD